MINATFADLIRRIQRLACTRDKTPVEAEEFEFYKALYEIFGQTFQSNYIENIVPFDLRNVSFERAQSLARPLGIYIVEGGSGTIYLSWSKGLDVD